jgi:hypothetical protein
MEQRELRGLLGSRDGQAHLLRAVEPFGELYPRAGDRKIERPQAEEAQGYERINFRQPSVVLALFENLDAYLRGRLAAIANNEPLPTVNAQQALSIGNQLCSFGLHCDLSVDSPDDANDGTDPDPHNIARLRPEELFRQLKMHNDSEYELVEQLISLKRQFSKRDMDAAYCEKIMDKLVVQVSDAFAHMRAQLESLNICFQSFLAILDIMRKKYLQDLATLVSEVRLIVKEDDMMLCQQFWKSVLSWHQESWQSIDDTLVAVLVEIQDFCAPVLNVLMFRLTGLHEERQKGKTQDRRAEDALSSRIERWQKFLDQTLSLAEYVRIKPCNSPDLPAVAALQHSIVLMDRVSGTSPARSQAFAAAKMLLANISVVTPVDELLTAVRAASLECKEEIDSCTTQFQGVFLEYRENLKRQHLLVEAKMRAYRLAEEEAQRMTDGPVTADTLARLSVILRRVSDLKPVLEREQLVLSKISDHFKRVSALAASRSRKCPMAHLDGLKQLEKEARTRITRLANDTAQALERLNMTTSSDKSAQVEKMKNECLNRLNKVCVERNATVLAKLQQMPTHLQRETNEIKRTMDVIIQWCRVRGGNVAALPPQLLNLDVSGSLRHFLETRANLLIALHAFRRIKLFSDWAAG